MRTDFKSFLRRYGDALGRGDLETVAACWDVPALVLSDRGCVGVESTAQIKDFFGAAGADYRRRGIVATRPVAFDSEPISERVYSIDVQWAALDAEGDERGREHVLYLIRLDDEGAPRIQVTIDRS